MGDRGPARLRLPSDRSAGRVNLSVQCTVDLSVAGEGLRLGLGACGASAFGIHVSSPQWREPGHSQFTGEHSFRLSAGDSITITGILELIAQAALDATAEADGSERTALANLRE